jgi:hypothetical protein
MPFKMHTFDGKMICGKRGGRPFLEAIRPDPVTLACPTGTEKCSDQTTADNTICFDSTLYKEDECPITKFEFINEIGDCSQADSETLDFVNGVTLCYSKDADSMPATAIKVENLPCADPYYQMQLDPEDTNLQKLTKCPVEPNSQRSVSAVYKKVGDVWSTTEYDVLM